jgi:hypothetical protein
MRVVLGEEEFFKFYNPSYVKSRVGARIKGIHNKLRVEERKSQDYSRGCLYPAVHMYRPEEEYFGYSMRYGRCFGK